MAGGGLGTGHRRQCRSSGGGHREQQDLLLLRPRQRGGGASWPAPTRGPGLLPVAADRAHGYRPRPPDVRTAARSAGRGDPRDSGDPPRARGAAYAGPGPLLRRGRRGHRSATRHHVPQRHGQSPGGGGRRAVHRGASRLRSRTGMHRPSRWGRGVLGSAIDHPSRRSGVGQLAAKAGDSPVGRVRGPRRRPGPGSLRRARAAAACLGRRQGSPRGAAPHRAPRSDPAHRVLPGAGAGGAGGLRGPHDGRRIRRLPG